MRKIFRDNFWKMVIVSGAGMYTKVLILVFLVKAFPHYVINNGLDSKSDVLHDSGRDGLQGRNLYIFTA